MADESDLTAAAVSKIIGAQDPETFLSAVKPHLRMLLGSIDTDLMDVFDTSLLGNFFSTSSGGPWRD